MWYPSFLEKFFAKAGVEKYDIDEKGRPVATCSGKYKDVYILTEGLWLQVAKADYTVELSNGNCGFRFVSIDAPFNIIGMPVFIDYYVEHTFGPNASMNFSPNSRETKPAPEKGNVPEQMLDFWLATQDVDDGELWALIIAVLVAATVLGILVWQAIVLMNDKTVEVYIGILIIVGGLVGAIIIFVILFWILLIAFFPGDNVGTVTPSDEAIVKVSAAHMSLFTAVSYIFYSAISRMKAMIEKNRAAAPAPTVEAEDEPEVIANILQ